MTVITILDNKTSIQIEDLTFIFDGPFELIKRGAEAPIKINEIDSQK